MRTLRKIRLDGDRGLLQYGTPVRGYGYPEDEITVHDSSLATRRCVWLTVKDGLADEKVMVQLDRQGAKALIRRLEMWLFDGQDISRSVAGEEDKDDLRQRIEKAVEVVVWENAASEAPALMDDISKALGKIFGQVASREPQELRRQEELAAAEAVAEHVWERALVKVLGIAPPTADDGEAARRTREERADRTADRFGGIDRSHD